MIGLLILLIALFAVPLVAGGAYLSVKYQQSPEKQWKNRILASLARAKDCCADLSMALTRANKQWEAEQRSLKSTYLGQLLASIRVEELESFPGIGPATISRLRGAGHTNLAHLQRAHLDFISGLGEKRLADIASAQRTLIDQVQRRFDCGQCAEARAFKVALASRQREVDQQLRRTTVQLRAAEQVRNHVQRLADHARAVTFFAFLTHQKRPLLATTVLQAPVPDLDACIAKAERETQSRPATGVSPPAVAPAARPPQRESPPPLGVQATPVAPGAAPLVAFPAPAPSNQAQRILELTVQFAFLVARCDGHLAKKETEWIAKHIGQRYSYDPALFNRARALCVYYETAAVDVDACLEEINASFTPGHKTAMMKLACAVAAAAGEINKKEIKYLQKLSQRLNVPLPSLPSASVATAALTPAATSQASKSNPQPSIGQVPRPDTSQPSPLPIRSQALKSSTSPAASPQLPSKVEQTRMGAPIPSPAVSASAPAMQQAGVLSAAMSPAIDTFSRQQMLALLEIESSTPLSPSLIRRQYARLLEKYAPDKMSSMGSEFGALAKQKRHQIEQAARTLIAPWKEELVVRDPLPGTQDLRHNPELDQLFGA